MARPREFNVDKALEGAMGVFWEHGYEQASLPDLLSGMGITRGSLYKAFTDKRTLFLTILERYDTMAVQPAVEVLTNEEVSEGMQRIEKLFHSILEIQNKGDNRGCLLCSAAAGPANYDKEIGKVVTKLLEKMKTGFAAALLASNAKKQLPAKKIESLADMLVTNYVGLKILVRSHASNGMLKSSVNAVLSTIRAETQ
ncbi:MAG: TetR/AcrR family transcriptional regulator [Pseudomonadota bacterium]